MRMERITGYVKIATCVTEVTLKIADQRMINKMKKLKRI